MKHLLLIALSLPALTLATPKDSAGHWQGAGSTFDASGHEVSPFTVSLTNTTPDANTVDSVAVITLPGGQTEKYTQKIVVSGDGFTIETADGKGKGGCFGEGLCLSYVGDEKHGVSTTIIHDGRNQLRLLSTELDNGQPVHFIRQRLQRVD